MRSVSNNTGPFPRLAGVLISPCETLEGIGRTPTCITPIVIAILIAMAGNAFYYWRVNPDWEQRVRARIDRHQVVTGETLSPDQVAQQVAVAKMLGQFFILLPAVSTPVFCFVVAGFYLLVFGMAFLRAPPFKKILSVVAWSKAAITIVGVPIVMLVVIAMDKERLNDLDPESSRVLQSSPGALLPEHISPAIKSLVGSLDIFTTWFLVLLIIGFAGIVGLASQKTKTWKVAMLVTGTWLVWVLTKAGLAFVFGY